MEVVLLPTADCYLLSTADCSIDDTLALLSTTDAGIFNTLRGHNWVHFAHIGYSVFLP